MHLINEHPRFTCLAEEMCLATEGMGWKKSKMKHSLEDVDRWLYHVRAEVAREDQGDDVLFNDTLERFVNANGRFHFSSSQWQWMLV